jgi:hypothetical protein
MGSDHVNCSGLPARYGNFHLGCLPECNHLRTAFRSARKKSSGFQARCRAAFRRATPPNRGQYSQCSPRCGVGLSRLYAPFRVHRVILAGWGESRQDPQGGRIPFLEARCGGRKCLWKWLFFRHSHSRLKMALWMLCNLEHPSCVQFVRRDNPDPRG